MSTSDSLSKTIIQKTNKVLSYRKPWIGKLVKATWIFFLCVLIGIPLWVISVNYNVFGLFGNMPSLVAIENPENDLSSELISADGVSLGRYFRYNRSQVHYDELSPEIINTLILSEDHRFYNHAGMDFWAYVRAAFGIITLNPKGGGSTITQQLAKNLYTQNPDLGLDGALSKLGKYPKRLIQKTKEWIISFYLEKNFTKEEILTMYLNTSTFGNNTYGIKVAAETYFDKLPDSLNIQESAVLVGLLQANTAYDPVNSYDRSFGKRNEVLYKLRKYDYINTDEEFDSIRALPIELKFRVQNQNVGLAPYFRSIIQTELMAWAREHGYDLWNSGLKIYTTIDSRLQTFAEEAVAENMKKQQKDFYESWKGANPWVGEDHQEIKGFLQSRIKQTDAYRSLKKKYGNDTDSIDIMLNLKKEMRIFTWDGEVDTVFSSYDSLNYYKRFLQAGFLSMDANTGEIKAWVGGLNHKFFKYDHVRQAKRQPGSTFKPFVYGAAIEAGYNPCQELRDVSPQFMVSGGVPWSPKNSDGTLGSGKLMTIRHAMAESVNSITAQLMQKILPENVVKFAHRVGIQSKLDAVPTLCLGVSDVSLFEMVGAYGTFVNSGIYTTPYYISRIEDKNGNVIENFTPKRKEAISEQTAYKMVYMLRGGVEERGGTSAGLKYELKEGNEIGGKTGTTDNASDAWYMGVTKDLVSGAWVGGDERSIHFRSWAQGAGSKTARPIWEKYMLKVYNATDLPYKKGPFKHPGYLDITLGNCNNYAVPEDNSDPIQELKIEN